MAKKAEIVTIRIEPHSDLGIDRVADLVRQMTALMKLLKDLSADSRGSEIEVLSLTKNSPLEARIRTVSVKPEPKRDDAKGPPKKRIRGSAVPIRKLQSAYRSVTRSRAPRTFDAEALLSLRDCAKSLQNDVAYIETDKGQIVIDKTIIARIEDCLEPPFYVYGTVTGTLEILNIHAQPYTFNVYPIGDKGKIKCSFQKELLSDIVTMIGHRVIVTGMKECISGTDRPLNVDVEKVEVIADAPDGAWLTLLDDLTRVWEEASEEDRLAVLQGLGE